MSQHTIKGLREQFKAVGKFHTPPDLAIMLRSYIPGTPSSVYDPTCGAGALLSVFPGDTEKYGQDIDESALNDARLLPGFHGHHGDVLASPAWVEQRFPAIVANPPFSIRWEPQHDARFSVAPCIPTAARADFAFLLHILHMLADGGTAAVLSFPGVLYRGQREAQIRAWMIERNVIDRVVSVPGSQFTDTTIATAVIVIKKGRASDAPVFFEDLETGLEKAVTAPEIRANDYCLSVNQYVQAPQPPRIDIDPWLLEQQARKALCDQLRREVGFSKSVAEIEGWPWIPFVDDLAKVLDELRGGHG